MKVPASDFLEKSISGASILGDITVERATAILMGTFDTELKCALARVTGVIINECEGIDVDTPEVLSALDRLKGFCRRDIQTILSAAEREEINEMKREQQELLRKAQHKVSEMNKPHELGTVAEIALKYGMSKSEVRKRKADGSLEQYLEAINNGAIQIISGD